MARVVAEDILTGTNHIIAAITTPVAIPMGMTTYGLDIVVKFGAFPCVGAQQRSRCLILLWLYLATFAVCQALKCYLVINQLLGALADYL